ncbi:hypothetical protein, partial [Vibrio coralliirubri]|uniref:hypothetical protein n=1 Tax=Vibrio coralliirubri TaxID=1516159 RepID=UPI00065E1251
NLSTPAIYEASAEMLRLFCICCFYEAMLGAGSPARSNLSTPAIFKALAEMLEPFCFLKFDKLQKVVWYKQPITLYH